MALIFVSEWFKFVVEVAKTSFDLSAKQGTLASSTTKLSAIGRESAVFHAVSSNGAVLVGNVELCYNLISTCGIGVLRTLDRFANIFLDIP